MKIAFQRLFLKTGPDRDSSRPHGPSRCRNTRMDRFAIDFDKPLIQRSTRDLQSLSSIAVALESQALQQKPLPSDRRSPNSELPVTLTQNQPLRSMQVGARDFSPATGENPWAH